MRISVKISKERPLPKNILLVATEWFTKVLGFARIDLHKDSYVVYLESKGSGKGVAKALSIKVDEVLQKLADDNNISFFNKVTFMSREAKTKLDHYFIEFGDEYGYQKTGEVWHKYYVPKKSHSSKKASA